MQKKAKPTHTVSRVNPTAVTSIAANNNKAFWNKISFFIYIRHLFPAMYGRSSFSRYVCPRITKPRTWQECTPPPPPLPHTLKRGQKFAKLKAHKSTGTTRLANFDHFSRAKRTFGILDSAVNNCQAPAMQPDATHSEFLVLQEGSSKSAPTYWEILLW